MRYGSVCSGIEAATAAWHHMGWEPAFFSEIEAFPRAVLEHRYPEVPLHGDFTTIEENQYGKIDLLVGGTPCQSFSVAGLRGGLDDDRGNLALEFCRLAQREQPRWIVWENVPGVLSSGGGRDFGSILGALEDLGYGLAYRVLDAQYFGVAQRRRRVFVVGYLGDWRRAAAVLFERNSMCGHPAPSREARKEATRTVALSPYECGGVGSDSGCGAPIAGGDGPDLTGPLTAGMHNGPRGTEGVESNHIVPVPQPYSIMPMNSGKDYKTRETDVAQPIMAGGPVGGNQGGDFIVAPFDTTQVTSPHNYSNPKAGDPCHPLAAGAHPPAIISFSSNMSVPDCQMDGTTPTLKLGGHGGGNPPEIAIQDVRGLDKAQNGKGWSDEGVSYTVDTHATQGVAHAVAFSEDGTARTLTARYDSSPCADRGPDVVAVPHHIAFSAKDHGGDATEEMPPTLRAGGHSGSHANAGVMPAVAYQINTQMALRGADTSNTSREGIGIGEADDPAFTLQAAHSHAVAYRDVAGTITSNYGKQPDSSDTNLGPNLAVAFQPSADCLTAAYGTKWNGNASATNGSLFARQQSAVRRLTPVECERLQGFPDNFTAIPWKKKDADNCPDGPRYKALGNSMAVPVMRWIGERIQLVDDLTSLL